MAARIRAALPSLLALALALALVAAPRVHASDVAKSIAAPKETGTSFARFVQDRNGVTVIEFTGNYDSKLPDGSSNLEPRAVVAREFYRFHPDAYDMLVVFTQFPIATDDAFAFYHSARNQVLGLGIPSFDNTPSYGSQGKLLGMIDMADLQRHAPSNLNPNFDTTLTAFSHEFLHQFAAHVKYRRADGSIASDLIGRDDAHWSYLLDSGGSVLYGSKWRDNGDGTFTAVEVESGYSPLDLYLMGFRKKEDVPPFSVIDAPGVDPTQIPSLGATITGTRRMVTIDDVIAAEGPRVPDAGQSQKEFRMAFIFLVRPGAAPSDGEVVALNDVRRAIGTRFGAMTGGVANINVFAEGLSTAATGAPPGLPPSQSPPATSVNLGLAASWLESRQKPDGSWSDTFPTAVRDSAVSAAILQDVDPGFTGLPLAATWLDGRATSSVDFLSRKLATLSIVNRAPVAAHADELAAMQNADGGWGATQGYGSNPLDTALALQALARRAAPADGATANGYAYLRATQNADGGWGNFAGGTSRTSTSAKALAALLADPQSQDAVAKARTFLAGRQNADGGFGDSPSSVHDTANVVAALIAGNATSSVRFGDAVQYLGVNQRVNGSWDDSVYSTALALDVLARANAMNWAITGFAASPARTTDGQRVALSVTVRNTGNNTAPAGKLRVYDGDPSAGGIAIGPDGDIPLLVAGASATVSLQWNTLGKAGSRTLYAVVDPDHAQQQLSVRDDVATLQYVVDGALAAADLLVSPPDVAISPSSPTQLPATVTVTALLTNAGFAAASDVKVALWQGTGAARQRVAETVIPTFNARSTQPVSFQATVTSAGSTTFTVEIDPDHAVEESDETNNAAEASVSTAADIDLEVRASDIAMDKPAPRNGEDVQFTVKIRNRGTVATPDFAVRYSIAAGGTTTPLATNTIHLAAGEEVTQSVPWRASGVGSATFAVEVDPAAAVVDSDRGNNAAQLTFTVSSDSGPSLATSFRDLVAVPNPALEASPLAISAVVRNLGDQAAAPVEVAFYNGDPAQGGVQLGALQTLASLGAGESATVSIQWGAVPDHVTKLLFVVVDPESKIAGDVARDDNRAFITVAVKSLPDLAVSGGNLVLTPALPRPGDAVTLAARVDNLGQQDAANVLVRVYDGDPAAGGVQVGGDQVVSAIAAQSSGTATFAWTFPQAAGDRTLFVQVDPQQSILETNRSNNSAQMTVGVQSGDATTSARYFSPDGDGVLDTVDFTFRLQSPRTVSIQVLDAAGTVVRRYTGPELAGTTASRWTWDGTNDTGSVLLDDDYRIQAVDATTGDVLGEGMVTLDTNRTSLVDAIGTPYGVETNLSCSVPNQSIGTYNGAKYIADGSRAYFLLPYGNAPGDLPAGLYSVSTTGGDLRVVVPNGSTNVTVSDFWVSGDGAHIVLDRHDGSTRTLWVANGEGGDLHALTPTYLEPIGFGPGSSELIALENGTRIVAISLATGDIRPVYDLQTINVWALVPSPDGTKVLVGTGYSTDPPPRVDVIDVATGAASGIETPDSYNTRIAWAPDSRAFFIARLQDIILAAARKAGSIPGFVPTVSVYGADGQPLRTIAVDGAGEPHDARWGDDSSAFFVQSGAPDWCNDDEEALCAADAVIRRASVATGELTDAYRLAGRATSLEGGWYGVSQRFMRVPGRAQLLVEQDSPDPLAQEKDWLVLSGVPPFASRPLTIPDEALREGLSAGVGGGSDSAGFGAFGRIYFYSYQWNASLGGNCVPFHNSDFWVFRTLRNLTADLRVERSTSLLKLRGTAADAHFASYRLDYAAAAAPATWLPVAPVSTVPVIDGELAQWTPPAPGAYLVRLTVEDAAGNRREAIKRVTWGANALITDVYRTPEFISPNADGVQDRALVHYRVVEPANLEFHIDDDQGQRVRTITRSEPAIGVEKDFEWDGRDEAGNVVHDGVYKLTVLDYEFAITVDTVAPAPAGGGAMGRLDLRILPVAYDDVTAPSPIPPLNQPHVRLDWAVADANFAKVVVEREDAGQPGVWAPWFESNRKDIRMPYDPLLVPLETASRGRFRVTASDAAGNTTTLVLALPPQVVVANAGEPGNFGAVIGDTVPMDDLSNGIDLEIAETVAAPTAQVAVEFQGPVAPGAVPGSAWSQRVLDPPFLQALDAFPLQQSTDGAFGAHWDMRELTAAGDYYFRVRITDSAGQAYTSVPILVRKPATFVITDARMPSANELDVTALEKTGLLIQTIDLMVSSAQDPAFATERVLWSRPGASTIAGLGEFQFSVANPFRTCVDYDIRLRATVSGRSEPIYSDRYTVRTCTFVKTVVDPVVAACGVQPAGQLQVDMSAVNELQQNVPLALLEFGRKRADGTDDILYSKVNPGIGAHYAYTLSTVGLAEGTHAGDGREYFSRVTDIQNRQAVEGVRIVVDRTPVDARITVPIQGQRLCALRTTDGQGTAHSYLDLEGTLVDAAGTDYQVEYGQGEDPQAWSTAYTPPPLGCPAQYDRTRASGAQDEVDNARNWVGSPDCGGITELTGTQVAGRLARLFDLNGTYTARLKARDWGGFQSCPAVTFYVDGRVETRLWSLDRTAFAPGADGAIGAVNLTYHAEEPLALTVSAYRRSDVTFDAQGHMTVNPGAAPVRRVADALDVFAGDGVVSWDGRDDGGALVDDGTYVLVATYRDTCGNAATDLPFQVVADRTPPALSISVPGANAEVSGIVAVSGSVSDASLASFVLEFGQGADPQAWSPVASGTQNVAQADLGSWDTLGLAAGDYTLRLRASDRVGNEAETRVAVTVAENATLIAALEAAPGVFSPNGDGQLDQAALRFSLDSVATVTLAVYDAANTRVRTLLDARQAGAGGSVVSWDGRNDGGAVLADGAYQVQLDAVNASGSTQTVRVPVAIDTTAPALAITAPDDGFARGLDAIVGSIGDANLQDYTVTLRNLDSGATLTLDQGTDVRSATAFGELAGLPEGRYEVDVAAQDHAGNRQALAVPFQIDNTPPVVALTAPLAGAVLGMKASPFGITGSIDERNLKLFQLNLSQGAPPIVLASGATPPPATIHALDLAPLADGVYTLQLLAQDQAGWTGSASVEIAVDKTPPTAAITAPAENGYLRLGTEIRGTAADPHFKQLKLEIAPGPRATASHFTEIASSGAGVDNDLLARVSALPPDGVQTLRLTVVDQAENASTALVQVTVDTTPPAVPAGLSAKVQNRQDVALAWTAGTEPDLAGYYVYRDGLRITPAAVATNAYTDAAVAEGDHRYAVSAVDAAGNESAPSPAVTARVSLSTPTAIITAPARQGSAGGVVAIQGSAYAPQDFKEFRVSVGAGTEPASYTLLRRSTIPAQGETLAQWNTSGLAEGSTYTIQLEAEDTFGAIGRDAVVVTIDNTAPARPVNLQATVSGADVTLTWAPNTEADLDGYLLYRNEHFANQSGPAVGDVRQFLIRGTSYVDKSVPDGAYDYTVVAVDKAANESLPSDPAHVSIDRRAPAAVIVKPAAGAKVDRSTYVLAASDDNDIAQVQLQYRAVGASTWTNLGAALTQAPYGRDWDLSALPYGDYELRAVATDLSGKVDPAPAVVRITRARLDRPPTPTGLAATVNGGLVTLSWTPVAFADLQGYVVERTDASGGVTRIDGAGTGTTLDDFVDTDGVYVYTVASVDTSGVESAPSTPVQALVFSVDVTQPYTPTDVREVTLRGRGRPGLATVVAIYAPSGDSEMRGTADAQGAFAFGPITLEKGDTWFDVWQQDAAGNTSNAASPHVMVGDRPAKPTGLAGTVSGSDVDLAWDANSEPDLGAYIVNVDGLPQYEEPATVAAFGSSEDAYSPAPLAIDGDSYSTWLAADDDPAPSLTVHLAGQSLVDGVWVQWDPYDDPNYLPASFAIDGWDGDVWVELAKVSKDPTQFVEFAQPYLTVALRIRVTGRSPSGAAQVAEVYPDAIATVPTNAATLTLDGLFAFTVNAVSTLGLVGPASDATSLTVGDATAAPSGLTVTPVPEGAALDLAWTAPATGAPPIAYGIERATQSGGPYTLLEATPSETSFRDTGLANGTRYFYRVFGYNASFYGGTRSAEASGVPEATVAIGPPQLLWPASPAYPATVGYPTATVTGFAAPGAQVTLLDNGAAAGSARAVADDAYLRVDTFYGVPSPDGMWIFAAGNGGLPSAQLLGVAPGPDGDAATAVKTFDGVDPFYVAWSSGSRRVAYFTEVFDQGEWMPRLWYVDVDERVVHAVPGLTLEYSLFALSSDGRDAYVVGTSAGQRGLLRVALATGAASVVAELDGALDSLSLSPDGRSLAYTREGSIEVIDLDSNATRTQPADGAEGLRWSPAGDAIAYAAYASGTKQVFLLDFTGAPPRQLTTNAADSGWPAFSPDGARIGYTENEQVHVLALASGEETFAGRAPVFFDWLPSGAMEFDDYEGLELLRPAGHFRIPDVLFQAGTNRLTATASVGGPSSAPSQAAIVTYSTGDRPDLAVTVSDVVVLPGVPSLGESTRITATVRNVGSQAAAGSAVTMRAIDPDGAALTLADTRIGPLAPGESAAVVASWAPAKAGRHQVAVTADRLNEVVEASESNNVAVRDVTVVDGSAPRIDVSTDAAIYPQAAPVAIHASVVNGGGLFSGTVEMQVEDEQGFLVAALAPQTVANLDFGQSLAIDRTWSTGTTLPGHYAVRARLKDAGGDVVGEALAPFAIDAPLSAAVAVTTDRSQYAPGATAHIAAHVTFPSGAAAGVTGEVLIRVLDAAGQVRFESLQAVALGTTIDVAADWSSAGAAAGDYTATAEVRQDGRTIASGSSAFALVATTLGAPVVGMTAPADNAVFVAPARIVLAAGASSPNPGGSIAKVEFFEGANKLGEVGAPPYTLEWSAVPAGRYTVHAIATDDRGVATDSAPIHVAVDTLPTVSIDSPAANATYIAPAAIAITASAQDGDGAIAKIEIFQGALKLGECAASPCTATWNGAGAGRYTLTAVATDDLGGQATSAAVAIVVQGLLPPTITLTSPADGAVVNAPGRFDLAATAASANPGGSIAKVEFFAGTTKIGEALAAPFTFAWSGVAAGSYAVKARATDNAGLATDTPPVNVVVNALPAVSITSPASGTAFVAPAEISIDAAASDADGTIAKIEIFQDATKLGECAASPCNAVLHQAPAGTYTLTAKATDDRGASATSAPATVTVGNLAGTLALTPPTLRVGEAVQVAAQVTSPAAIASLPLEARVYDPATGATVTQWTTTAPMTAGTPFSWNFTWDTSGQAPGSYRVSLAENRAGTPAVLADVPLVLEPSVSVQLEARLLPHARVLVLAACYQSSGATDTPDLACAESRKVYLDQVLTALGVPHRVVTDADLFRSEMRCGDWNVYWLAGGRQKLKDRMVEELAQQVYAGKGLLVDGIYDAASSSLDAALGVAYVGSLDLARSYLVSPTDSLLPYGNFATAGRATRYSALAGAEVHARLDSASNDPAVVSHDFGIGRAVTLAFDLAATMQAAPQVQDDLAALLAAVAPDAREAGRPVAARVTVANAGAAATATIEATLPAGVTLASATPAPDSGTSWTFDLAPGETRTIELQLAADPGTYSVAFAAPGATASLDFDVASLSGGTHAEVVAALEALALTGAEATARDNAVSLVNQSSAALASSPETAVYDLLDAAKEAAKIASPGDADDRLARLEVATGPAICQRIAACLRPGQGAPTLTGYNMLVFGNASLSSGSVEGSVGVGGSATLSSQSIASQWAGDAARLIAGGNVTWSTGSVGIDGSGVVRAGGALTLGAGVGRRVAEARVATEDWNALKAYYTGLATTLAQSTGIAPIAGAGGEFTLRGADPSLNVFTLTSAQAASTRSLVLDVPGDSTVVVNVSGASVSFSSGQQYRLVNGVKQSMAQDPFATHVLFNFPQALSLAASSWSFQGTVLAPKAGFSFSSGSMFGQLLVGSLSSSSVGFQQCGTFMGTLP